MDTNVYPAKLSILQLESQNSELAEHRDLLQTIETFYTGWPAIKCQLETLLPARPGEEPAVHKARIGKAAYVNILASAINSLVGVLGLDPLVADKPGFEALHELAVDAIRQLALYKHCFVLVNSNANGALDHVRSLADLQTIDVKPTAEVVPIGEVLHYGDGWVKLRQIVDVQLAPFMPAERLASWVFIDGEQVVTYQAFVQLDAKGCIVRFKPIGGERYQTVGKASEADLVSEVKHGFSRCPIVHVEVANDLWAGAHAISLAQAHFKVLSAKEEYLQFAYAQRVWSNRLQPDDPNASYVGATDSPPPSGLQHVLVNGTLEWVEPSGQLVPHYQADLEQLELQLRAIVSQGGRQRASAAVQSGLSKELDYKEAHELAKVYGRSGKELAQQIAGLYCEVLGEAQLPALSGYEVLEPKPGLLEMAEAVSQLDLDKLAKLDKAVLKKLSTLLTDL